MPRRARLVLPNVPMHIVHRGNNKQPCFLRPSDFRRYLALLERAASEHECIVHAYVLMTNHVHLLLTGAARTSVARTMKSVAETYAMSFNKKNQRSGGLWEGRFHSSVVQDGQYLFNCYRYIEMNPVRARMIGTPAAYRWSSYRANAFGARSFVGQHELYRALGKCDEDRQAAYRALLGIPIDPVALKQMRDAFESGFAYGDDAFCKGLEQLTGRRASRRPRGRKPKESGDGRDKREDGGQLEMWSVPN
jgi:putative transposase